MTTLKLTRTELRLILEALDSHRYWQIGRPDQRNNGYVYTKPSDDNHADVREVNRLEAKLEKMLRKVAA